MSATLLVLALGVTSVLGQSSAVVQSSAAVQSSTITKAPTAATTAATSTQLTYPAVPLASKGPYAYPDGIPYKVDTDLNLIRGTQLGYNICNSTTENQESLCQTAFLNSMDDFCLWAPAEPGHNVGDIEGSMIAWCTKPGHGTRLIPEGALTGVQFTKTPDYVQVVGFIDQTQINMIAGDYGGEMDPHGADLRGNPMGGLVFSNKFKAGGITQGIEWHNFMGSNSFCLKVCDPAGPNAKHYCEHIFDRIGCAYNAPNNARNNVFESCDGDNQDFPGVYTRADGVVTTYTQPPESLGPIVNVGYTPRVPSSSNCQTFESQSVFTGLPSASVSPSASATASPTASGVKTAASGSASASAGSNTGSAAGAKSTTSGAGRNAVSFGVVVAAIVGGVFLL